MLKGLESTIRKRLNNLVRGAGSILVIIPAERSCVRSRLLKDRTRPTDGFKSDAEKLAADFRKVWGQQTLILKDRHGSETP